ncbi:diguanylate cyclase domain-containing protein [Shigella flexneri]
MPHKARWKHWHHEFSTVIISPFRIGLIEVYTSCSVGISLSPEHGSDSAAIIRHADTAMYTAKEGGRGQFCVTQK